MSVLKANEDIKQKYLFLRAHYTERGESDINLVGNRSYKIRHETVSIAVVGDSRACRTWSASKSVTTSPKAVSMDYPSNKKPFFATVRQ